jgi:hypothetical protein
VEKPCQAKRERKVHALTFKPVILKAAGPWQSKRPFSLFRHSRNRNAVWIAMSLRAGE